MNGDKILTDYEVAPVDWKFAGWYPSYWEYSKEICACKRRNDEWLVDMVLHPFVNEAVWLGMLRRELGGEISILPTLLRYQF